MRREIVAGLLLYGVTACAPEAQPHNEQLTWADLLGKEVQVVTVPKELPDLVADAVYASVDVGVVTITEKMTATGHDALFKQASSGGSAVRIAADRVLTAAHVMVDENNRQRPEFSCSDMDLHVRSQSELGSYRSDVVRFSAEFGDDLPDLALLETSLDGPFSQAPVVPIAEEAPLPGDVLYFVNYEPTADDRDRHPGWYAAEEELQHPAIYGGIMLQTAGSGEMMVMTGVQNYGIGVPELDTRGGASGGGVFNEAGELVGVSVSVTEAMPPDLVQAIASPIAVEIEEPRELTVVEPVTNDILNDLEAQLATGAVNCAD